MNTIVSKADLDDKRWLDQQVATLGDGIEAARAIWTNWTDLRNVGRFHHGQSAGDFIASQLGGVRLDLPRLIAALPDMSNRQIAAVAGVDEGTVRNRKKGGAEYSAPDAEPARVIGVDGKSYPGRVVGTTTAEVIEPDLPRGRPVPKRAHPDWWREVGAWLARARKEDARVLLELDARVHAAMSAAGLPL